MLVSSFWHFKKALPLRWGLHAWLQCYRHACTSLASRWRSSWTPPMQGDVSHNRSRLTRVSVRMTKVGLKCNIRQPYGGYFTKFSVTKLCTCYKIGLNQIYGFVKMSNQKDLRSMKSGVNWIENPGEKLYKMLKNC